MAMLPAYQIDPNPFGQSMRYAGESMRNALMAYGQMREKDNLRMGQIEALARTPGIGLAQAESLAADPALARNVLMQYSDPMLGMRKNQAEAELAMVPLKRQQIEADLAMNPLRRQQIQHGMLQQDRMFDMQAAQIKNQSPEGKAQIAINAGIAKGSPEFNEFVYGIKRPDFADQILSRLGQPQVLGAPMQPPQTGGPPATLSMPGQPGPRLMPQSFDGGQTQGDPSLIRVQSPGQAPAQPQVSQMVNTPMGQMTQDQARQFGFALALKGKGEAGKMMSESNPNALGKEGGNLVDKNAIGQFEAIGRLESMAREFDPNLQTKQARLGQWFNQQLAGWNTLGPDKKAELERFVGQRAAAINNFNLRLKEASGTAVSAQEFERNQAELPNPGTGILNGVFDGDDPVTYAAKMRKGINLLKMGMARNLYLKDKGFKGGVFTAEDAAKIVAVEQMPAIINRRGAEVEKQLMQANPRADKTAIEGAVKDALKKEFGI